MKRALLVVSVPVSLVTAWLVLRESLARMQRKSSAQAQAKAEQERRQFLRRLDHELRNPLTAIQVALANLADARTKKDRQASLGSVQAQVQRIASLVSSLRKLAELEVRPIDHDRVDLANLLEMAVRLVQERPESRLRNVTLSIPRSRARLLTIHGDADLLFLALYNILDNALKFGRPGDSIDVRAFVEDQAILVQVTDTGPGIPDEEVPHVWEELYRGRAAQAIPGSGLGLGLVRTIVERHGGQVLLSSQVGEGTVVTMQLPAE